MPADRHIETQLVPGRRLGRRPHDPNRRALKLGDYLTGTVPPHAAAAEHFSRVSAWLLGENDKYGTCGPTGVANAKLLSSTYLTDSPVTVDQQAIFDLYRLSNPDFDPVTGAGDNGVQVQDMLNHLVQHGIGGNQAVAFAKVDVSNLAEIQAAIDLFGFLLLGVDLEAAQQAQTSQRLWNYVPSPEWGGHCVMAGRFTGSGSGPDIGVITWAEVVDTTDAFWENQCAEAWVVLFPEALGAKHFEQGLDLATLARDYEELTKRPFPSTPSPAPVPVPGHGELAELWSEFLSVVHRIETWFQRHLPFH